MAYYLLEYRYQDLDARARVRPEHLARLAALHEDGVVVMAGPLADQTGAVIVLQVADEAAAQAVHTADPYTREGVTTDVTIREWNVVIPPTQ